MPGCCLPPPAIFFFLLAIVVAVRIDAGLAVDDANAYLKRRGCRIYGGAIANQSNVHVPKIATR
jgi:hypothetical protein